MTRQDYVEQWKYEVENNDTTLGLDAWIEHNSDRFDEDEDRDDTPSLDTSFHDHEMDIN